MIKYLFFRARKARCREMASIWKKQAIYLEASGYLLHKEFKMGREKLETILSERDEENDPFMIAWPLLKMGMSHDMENDREQALIYYHLVKDRVNGGGAQYLAEKYINAAAKEGDPFLVY